ncbi:LA2681 family HEPN domain-containing protein [Psychrobacter sp.]|uniref:LA2681 family HEPN domain-containing protein n=1 Tax=Psychrobacter sp. TaxID=56811 RepID=UPI003565D899
MEDSIHSRVLYTNLQLDNASEMIDKGQFEESYKLCLYLKELLEEVHDLTEPSVSYAFFRLAGLFIDLGNRNFNLESSHIGLEIIESNSFENCLTRDSYYYCLANAKSNLTQNESNNHWKTDVSRIERLSEIGSLLLKATMIRRRNKDILAPQVMVNMGINLYQQYRFSEALSLFDKINCMGLDIPESWVNRSECLALLNQITEVFSIKQYKEVAKGYYHASVSSKFPPDWQSSFLDKAKRTEEEIKEYCLDLGIDIEDDNHLDEQEYQSFSEYRKWCLDSFLSLSEHGLYCKCYGSARDNLTIPLNTRAISGNFIYPMEKVLNRLKSEFGLARLMLYEYKFAKRDNDIDDDACYAELYDNELLGTNIEKLRTAFRICFGILDKIGNAVALLFDLQLKNNKGKVRPSYFHTFWELENEDRLQKFEAYNNEGLIGLYSIACDLNHKFEGELSFYKQWRNALEHSFVFIYENEKPESTEASLTYYEEPVFISESEFVESAEHVLQLTRSAIFSFVFAVRIKAEKEALEDIPNILSQDKFIERKKYT